VEIQRREAALEYEVPDYPMLDLSAIPDDPEPVAAPAPNPNGTGKPTVAVPRPHTGNGGTTGSADAAAPAAPNAGTVHHDGGDNAPAPDATMQLHTSDAATASTGASMSSGDTVLKDEDEIIAMVKRLRRSYRPQVENCYNQRLKTAGDLAGVWKLTFTINRDGSVSNVGARGTSTKDGELEACMIKQASAWRFQKIAAALPVTDQYTFSPSE
jgi:outer membrane biosynthesis protein TonB